MCQSTPRAIRELPVSTRAPAIARDFLRASTCAEHHSTVVDDAVLMVSELVTNSVLHGGTPVVIAVDCVGEALEVRIRDGSTDQPAPRHARGTDEGGRGLDLVASLSSDWGVDAVPEGKNVWFVVR